MPAILMRLDSEASKPVLLEVARTLNDETVELAIADALATTDVQADLVAMFASETPNVRRVACVIAGRRSEPEAFRWNLRERALDVNERVATASVDALREQIRTQGVRGLVEGVVTAMDKSRRWILMDQVAKHARGRKEFSPILLSVLAPLYGSVTPLEAKRLNQAMKKGR